MSIEIDPKYDYLLSKITFPDTRDEFILRNGIMGIENIYAGAIRSGVEALGENVVGKTLEQIIDAANLAEPKRRIEI